MPAQTNTKKVAAYAVGDTAPPLRMQLQDENGVGIDLTGHQVFIEIAYASWSFYYSPTERIVDAECTVEVGTDGWVQYTPLSTDLTIAGEFQYRYRIEYLGGAIQHVPPDSSLPMYVSAVTGGG